MIKRILFTFLGTTLLLTSALAQEATSKVALGEYKYTMTMQGRGQEMEFDINRTVKEEDGKIIIIDNTATPFGSSENISTVDGESLMTISQSATGFMTSNINYTAEKISGETADYQGNKTPIDIDIKERVHADGSGIEPWLVNLPLEIGYKEKIKIYNPFQMNVIEKEYEVTALEEVEVPGGTFQAYKVDISIPDFADYTQSTWVSTEMPRMVLKSVINAPQMGEMVTVYAGKKGEKKKKKKKKE
ncbi:MAG: hypothetical protein AAFO82_06810 [Bacteroidota bacterium]